MVWLHPVEVIHQDNILVDVLIITVVSLSPTHSHPIDVDSHEGPRSTCCDADTIPHSWLPGGIVGYRACRAKVCITEHFLRGEGFNNN